MPMPVMQKEEAANRGGYLVFGRLSDRVPLGVLRNVGRRGQIQECINLLPDSHATLHRCLVDEGMLSRIKVSGSRH
jgi:hypothetical protein